MTNYTHLQLLAASEARAVLSGHGFEVLELQPQQGVDYEGATYVRVYVPWEPLARLLGGLAGTRPVKNLVAGRNKLFFAARLSG